METEIITAAQGFICEGCLSMDRKLSAVIDEAGLKVLYSFLGDSDHRIDSISLPLLLCWECTAIVNEAISRIQPPHSQKPTQKVYQKQSDNFEFSNIDIGSPVLPDGYEPVDRTKDKTNQRDQETQSTEDIKQMLQHEAVNHRHKDGDCDLNTDNSIKHTVVVPAPKVDTVEPVMDVDDNEVAIYFGDSSTEPTERTDPVTEISVSTSISEGS
ncbi:uncharacterized protein [Battus philenor]|uniref:uncharacterized protein n=1 Tax=Battus philenor TaxID=42288 RepID=UPI0035D032DF